MARRHHSPPRGRRYDCSPTHPVRREIANYLPEESRYDLLDGMTHTPLEQTHNHGRHQGSR